MSLATATKPLLLGPNIKVQLRRIGPEQQPLLVVDDVLADPWAMVDAARAADFYRPPHTYYPGLNAPLPEAYYRTVVTALRGALEAAFGLSRAASLKYFGFFALATTPAGAAQPIQKIPHHDSPDPNRLAMVHYLCRGPHGGTGFFRHKATGWQSIGPDRHEPFLAASQDEHEDRAAYAGGDMAHYEQVGEAEMVFNRLIVYRNHVLHAGLLGQGGAASDPTEGRLTANGFLEAVESG
jgi:hypothetical protein